MEKWVVLDLKALQRVAITTVILVFGLLLLGRLLGAVAAPLILILLAIVLMMGLNPLVVALETRFRVPRRVGAVLVVLGLLALIGGFVAIIIPLFVAQGMKFADTLPEVVQNLQHNLKVLAQRHPLLAPLLQSGSALDLSRFLSADTMNRVLSLTTNVVSMLASVGLLLTLVLFLLMNPEPLVKGILSGFKPDYRPVVERTLIRIGSQLGSWLLGVTVVSVTVGLLVGLGLWLLGFQNAFLFGMIAGFTNPIPFIGPWLGISLPVLVALSQGSLSLAVGAIVVLVVVQQIDGSLISPTVFGRTVQLHPASLLMGVLIFGALMGVVGIFLTVPLAIIIKALYEEIYLDQFGRPQASDESVAQVVAAGQGEQAVEESLERSDEAEAKENKSVSIPLNPS